MASEPKVVFDQVVQTKIVPSSEALKVLNDRLADLEKKAQIEVTDQQSFIAAAETKLDFEMYIRAVEEHFEPELAPLEEQVTRIKLQKASLLTPVRQWLRAVMDKRYAWANSERKAAAVESKKLGVAVQPVIPTVPGAKNQIHYYAEVDQPLKFIATFLKAKPKQRLFLSRFLMINQQEVSKYARDTKDSNAVEKAIPGSRAWSKG